MATLTLEMPEELKARLEAVAANAVAPDAYALATLEAVLTTDYQPDTPFWMTATPQQRAEDFVRWASSHTQGAELPNKALRRESMYEDR